MKPPPPHDPGVDLARERGVATAEAPRRVTLGGCVVRVGTASWTDPTLTARGLFYPDGAKTPEKRLQYYASQFSTVEVDATYYALPTPANASLWAERTPDDFVFDVKAYAPLTGHPFELARLPKVLRETMPPDLIAKGRAHPDDLPPGVGDEVWRLFREALYPLWAARKLGAVLFQYPPWFVPGGQAREAILDAQARLAPLPLSIEFRNRRWFTAHTADRTLQFLADHDLTFVAVDEPQGLESSVPDVIAATSRSLAVVRLHGRRGDTWGKKGTSTTDKYRYLYDTGELVPWAERVAKMAKDVQEIHVVFNNCYANYGTTNAKEFLQLLSVAVTDAT